MPPPDRFRLQAEHSLLLVVDVQERLSAAMDQDGLQRAVKHIGILLESAHALSVSVIVTEQYVKGLGPTVAAVKEKTGNATFFEKISFSCCGNADLMAQLRQSGRTQIVVCGMETHVCVQQTVLDLLQEGYVVHVVKDAVMSRAPANRDTALEAMTLAGAVPTSTETAVFQWLRVAGTEVFRQVSKQVK
ncbi:MAG: hydrolase [Sideroxydans sp.]|nr:hydrolase [Sideroxydans sp.]